MQALPLSPEKTKIANEVDGLVNGAILLGIPEELAWAIFFERKDCETIGVFLSSLSLLIALVFLALTWTFERGI
jgi:hypothetical protein